LPLFFLSTKLCQDQRQGAARCHSIAAISFGRQHEIYTHQNNEVVPVHALIKATTFYAAIRGAILETTRRREDATAVSFSNNFPTVFAISNTAAGTTNYLDAGAATNARAQYYLVRLVPRVARPGSWLGLLATALFSCDRVEEFNRDEPPWQEVR
jgi:hypothetical protein